jgi:hypothetical protein
LAGGPTYSRFIICSKGLAVDNILLKIFAPASFLLLASCGGDGGPAPTTPPASPAGFYVGTSGAGPTLREVSTLILDNGRVYSLYSGPAGGPPTGTAGAVIGNGVTTGNTFTASPTRDFNFEVPSVTIGSLSASFTPRSSVSGTVSGGMPAVTFTGTYAPAYENAPSLATAAGTYIGDVGFSGGSEGATVVVAANGTITATSTLGCNLSGAASLHASGNVYDVTITVGAGCVFPPATVLTGHAYLNGTTLHSIVMNPGLTDGLIFTGTR